MARPAGGVVLVLSAMGFPLTQLAIKRWGRAGATLTEAVCAGLLVRDAAMIASGTPRRLRPTPAALLWCELGAAVAAVATGLPMLFHAPPRTSRVSGLEIARRAAIGTLFGIHTLRFGIYLQPGHGLRSL